MAFKKPTSFLTDPDEDTDYSTADMPAAPQYVSPNPAAPPDPDLDPNAYSPVTQTPDGSVPPASWDSVGTPNKPRTAAEIRQEVAQLAAQRPEKGKAGIWRTLAAMGAGTLVGYGSRGAQGQDNVNNVVGAIMYPGYTRKLGDWSTQMSDKTTQAEQAEKIDSDARAATLGDANLANKKADTAYKTEQTRQLGLPDAPKTPTPVTEKVVVVGTDGKKKTEIHYIPDPNHPERYSVLGEPPSVEGGPKTDIEMRRAAYMTAHNGQEPDEKTVASWTKSVGPRTNDDWIAIASNPNSPPELLAQAKRALKLHTDQILAGRPERAVSETAKKDQAINNAFRDAGNDWNQVLANAQNGKYTDNAADIADHAQKMLKLSPNEQQKVEMADMSVQQVQHAIDVLNNLRAKHPNIIGNVREHPLNSLTRWTETKIGAEPDEVGAADAALETVMAMQPGQHGFRSRGAEEDWKKAAGVDPRTGKLDGSRAYLVNPDKTISGLQEILKFNQGLKTTIMNQHGKPQGQPVPVSQPAPAAAPPPPAQGKVYTQADVDAAVASHPGLTPMQAEQAFQAKGWRKQ